MVTAASQRNLEVLLGLFQLFFVCVKLGGVRLEERNFVVADFLHFVVH
jgi:hypothetical protein